MIKNKKYLAMVIGSIGLVSILFGTAYSWFTYQREGSSQELIAGDIYLKLNEGDGTYTNPYIVGPIVDRNS